MEMALSKNFEHQSAESKWYQHWLDKRYFASKPDHRESYTVVIPPPNVTGVLHMGHCLNNTIQDILVRRARMQGKNACWVPGTDHASIATEAKVVQMLREKGIPKSSISRDEFLQYAWEWKEKYGGIILQQLKKMGCSLDWDRTSFTMDDHYYQSVISVFNDLYKKGYIYRGKRMINWDVKAKTALSDEEVIFKDTQSKLYYLRYELEETPGEYITIATVRPETILGDTAICVHPNDERFRHLHGKFACVPLIRRKIPIITDEYVSMDFGTGALKITPAHDMNDYQLGLKHNLEIIDVLNDDGTMSADAQLYVGEERFETRKKIVMDLEAAGHVVKIEDYANQIGYSERTDVVVEPRLSLQWWVDMKKISGPALAAVVDDDIKFHPPKFKNLYRHWMENIKDWCISRQLWWGHRIPAWYDLEGNVYVGLNQDEALAAYRKQNPAGNLWDLKQDEDCLDTWFSSWLWPFEVFKGYSNPGNEDIRYYYPTQTLVTAPEIIFFWVARMIMAGFEYMDEKPFEQVYFTGIVRDKQGRKMSKSLGNSPDLLEMIDRYGADAVRFGIMISSPAGNDLLWDESSNEQGRNFSNKIWNALKLVKMWEERTPVTATNDQQGAASTYFAINWFEARLNQVKAELNQSFDQFRLSESLRTVYTLIWDDFCSWYLEWVKPPFGTETIDEKVISSTKKFFEELMILLHPFMPFITEEIYHELAQRKEGEDICIAQLTPAAQADEAILKYGKLLQESITGIRDARNKAQLKPKETISLFVQSEIADSYDVIGEILIRQVNADSLQLTDKTVAEAIPAVAGKEKFYLVSSSPIDMESQKQELVRELEYLKGFLISVEKKLGNEKFVQNAKAEVVEIERKKKADAEMKIRMIEESLTNLN
ncbi:MAG TPA: valine--tRNA ligase [Chitinophagaceae bacterium]|nr:valine--tRNA ligase [Chitinophagaceae bacterium]